MVDELLEAQADPDSASARRGAKQLASGCFELAYHNHLRASSILSRPSCAASSAIIMDSLLGLNTTLASNPNYSFSKAPYNSAADNKEHAFYP